MASKTNETSRKLSNSTRGSNKSSNSNTPKPSPPASISTPSPNTFTTPLPTTKDLTTLLNLPLRITLVGEKGLTSPSRIIEGVLYTYDPTTSFLVLSTPSTAPTTPSTPTTPSMNTAQNPLITKRSYHLIKSTQIISVVILSLIPDTNIISPTEALKSINVKDLDAKVAKAVREDQKERARIGGEGVTEIGQSLFDALEKTLPVRWSNTSIIVMDEVIINAPYHMKDVKGSKGERVERVIKVVSLSLYFRSP